MNPASYHLAVSMAACKVTGAIMYTMGAIAGLSPVKNYYTTLATGVLPVALVFCCNL